MVESIMVTCGMGEMKQKYEAARDAGQYLIIWDRNGNANTFFQYMEILNEMGKQKVAAAVGQGDMASNFKGLRSQWMTASKNGQCLCINMDKLTINWKEYKDDCFPCNDLFDFAHWRKPETYNTISNDEEKKTPMGDQMTTLMFNDKF